MVKAENLVSLEFFLFFQVMCLLCDVSTKPKMLTFTLKILPSNKSEKPQNNKLLAQTT